MSPADCSSSSTERCGGRRQRAALRLRPESPHHAPARHWLRPSVLGPAGATRPDHAAWRSWDRYGSPRLHPPAVAAGRFLAWCGARGLELRAIAPLHVAAYIRTHPGSVPTVKQDLAAIRMLGDPAAAVRGPKHVVTKGATPVLSPAEARRLLEAIDPARQPYAETTVERFSHYIGNVRGDRDYGQQSLNPKGKHPDDVFTDIQPVAPSAKARTDYPTQKPLKLLERIIAVSSDEGSMVLDPFCGCATACIAAEGLHREWVGIDVSPKAAELVRQRMRDELGMFYDGAHRTDIPTRTDLGKLRRYNSPENRRRLYGEQSGNCAGCNEHFEARHLEVDHIIARLKGGTDAPDNLQLLCGNCNRIKGARGMDYLRVKLQLR